MDRERGSRQQKTSRHTEEMQRENTDHKSIKKPGERNRVKTRT